MRRLPVQILAHHTSPPPLLDSRPAWLGIILQQSPFNASINTSWTRARNTHSTDPQPWRLAEPDQRIVFPSRLVSTVPLSLWRFSPHSPLQWYPVPLPEIVSYILAQPCRYSVVATASNPTVSASLLFSRHCVNHLYSSRMSFFLNVEIVAILSLLPWITLTSAVRRYGASRKRMNLVGRQKIHTAKHDMSHRV